MPTPAGCVLGVDPGLRVTGWALLDARESAPRIEYGVIRPPRGAATAVRLRAITNGLLEAIDAHGPSAVAVERPFVKENMRTALALGQAQAAALLAAAWRELEVFEYAPREIKQTAAGDGGATKEAVAEALRRQLRLEAGPRPLDASDALAVAYCHLLASCGRRRLLPQR